MKKEIKNLEPSDSNIGVDPYWEVRREAFRNGYDAAESDYWKKFRREAAKDFMCALIMTDKTRGSFAEVTCKDNAGTAIMYADELIRQLKEEQK